MIPHCLPLSAASPTVRQSVRQSDSTLRHHFQPLKLLPDTGKYPLFCSVTLQDLAASTGFHSSISSRPMVANDRPTVVRQSSDSVRQCPTVPERCATSDSPTVSDSESDSYFRQWSDSGPTVVRQFRQFRQFRQPGPSALAVAVRGRATAWARGGGGLHPYLHVYFT